MSEIFVPWDVCIYVRPISLLKSSYRSSLPFILYFCSNTVNSCKRECQHTHFRTTRKTIKFVTPPHISSYFVDYCLAWIFFRYTSPTLVSLHRFIHLSQLNMYINAFLKWGQRPRTSIVLKHVFNFKHVCIQACWIEIVCETRASQH